MSVSLVKLLTDIADAIREKKGTTGKINAQNMAFEIKSIEPPLDTIELKDPGKYDVKEYKYAQVLPSDVLAEFIGNLEGTATEIHIPEGTTKLRQYAIYNSNEIKIYIPKNILSFGRNSIYSPKTHIYYHGTLEEWYNINACLQNAYRLYIDNELITEINSITNFNKGYGGASALTNILLDRIFIPNGSTLSIEGALGNVVCEEIIFEGTINGELPKRCFQVPYSGTPPYKQIKIVLPTNITTIPQYCFNNQSYLPELIIPEGVTTIEDNAFAGALNAYGLDVVLTLPSTLTSIGQIYGRPKTVVMNCVVPPTTAGTIFDSKPTIIYIPAGTLTAYQTATNWSAYSDVYREMNEIALNIQAEIVNNESYQYSLDGGQTWSVFASSNINLEQIALIKFKNTSETTKLLIGKTAGATDIGSITDAELTYATEGSMTIYLRLEEITA